MKMLRASAAHGDASDQTQYLLGARRATRFLKRSSQYGKLELLKTSFVPGPNAPQGKGLSNQAHQAAELRNGTLPHWDTQTFADRCAGCHATAVDVETRAFSAFSLDCFTCHGNVVPAHTKEPSRVLLSKTTRDPRQIVSLCGQCHLRGGTAKSTGLPYPNTFVPGDNLFRDFQVDWSDAAIQSLPAIEQHVFISAREVAVAGRSAEHCLRCHDVHGQSTAKHRRSARTAICASCHLSGTDDDDRLRDELLPQNRLQTDSRTCEY